MTSEVIDTIQDRVDDGIKARRKRPAGNVTNRSENDMTEATTLIEQYVAIWNESSQERRRSLIDQTFADSATYVDPVLSGDGPDGIDAMVGTAQEQFPGHRVRLAGPVDAHHDRIRFTWELVLDGAEETLVAGTDFAILAPDGRLQSVTGFFDKVPAAV
jgi:hypothetical protein